LFSSTQLNLISSDVAERGRRAPDFQPAFVLSLFLAPARKGGDQGRGRAEEKRAGDETPSAIAAKWQGK